MSLARVLDARELTSDGFTLVIPQDWHQGRTAYGGFSAALALHAARQVGGENLPPLRSALVSFVAPLSGEIGVKARLLRTGRNAHWLTAEIDNEAGIGLTASFVFMRAGSASLALNSCPAPVGLIPVEQGLPVTMAEFTPEFLQNHFEVRFALPRSGEKTPDICWWVRPRERDRLEPMTALLLSADALPPGVLPLLSPRARVSSMTWQVNLLTPEPVTRDGWWLLRSTGDYAADGCSSQRMGIWNADGVAIASAMQSIALFD
jgi:acyl-CoA thioesterase